ncbi:MAG: HAMP domain-containing histidine kinase [Ectothiorhodospiraceae bacterium]|nr:HAMP domain-containing histidine kinase [Chromatiales bacterium]MCP5153684.1 HAMP domain-containing histidine kinase [Ectothiorhodospiraceae bacterium]
MRHSLRRRIFLACFGIGAAVSMLVGGLSVGLVELMEVGPYDVLVDDELARFVSARAENPDHPAPHTASLVGWAAPLGALDALPAPLRVAAPGRHVADVDGRELRVKVADHDGWRYAVGFDLTPGEIWEDRAFGILVVVVVLCMLTSALLGRWLSRQVVEPVARLAGRVAASGETAPDPPFAAAFADDEIGLLARTIDHHARRLAAFAERERRFAGFASHELRTEVAVGLGAVELALAGESDLAPATRHRLQRAERALQAMGETVEGLLELSRAQSGVADSGAPPGDCDLARVLGEVVADLRAIHAASIEVEVSTPSTVRTRRGAVRVALRNLLDNACVHGAPGAVTVRLDGARFEVVDRGPGIEGADAERLTEPGFRGRASNVPGEGLGLAIVERLAEHHGWRLRIDSAPGRGTRAVLDLGQTIS